MAMFGQAPRVDEDIIDVYQDEAMEVLPKHLVHEVLKYGWGVDKAIRHNQIFVVAIRGHQGSLPLVPLTYSDEVVRAAEVQLSEDSGTTEMFQGCRDERKWIAEFHCNTIQ